ncbi:DUF5329 family protein [Leptospira kanakyensis]|uniref:Uncharacterized protein n=1 Tax=Leptospira kanakyensis TaxID=2484968 RepID=A0A6N4QCY0_9LEPT|nr:DUF5329 family protein [Leptospira kanakyensis]MCW7468673.1 DUF5329 domain-containing protein [Leptospira kanakyensis]MCW7479666.1 DUF5329 domain-containing protein [Leptospira kanakyensis]TGK49909.1 hypothetical protein EHQ11_09230 [Leptospira kanakyensis]TGK58574.1 hypothetical protein EHQ16_13390 [Leptospira kanakyensis]TGK69047.1 hypothetical protein EHQ18_09390 [Leptospira kanakyensis]
MKVLHSFGTIFFVFIFLGSNVSFLNGKPNSCPKFTEEQKIEKLLVGVGKLKGSLIRNGETHSAEAAEKHLRYKLEEAKKSFFAPDPKEWTAKLFIEKIATKSFLTGTPYQIKFFDGKEIKSSEWLLAELGKIESCM